MRRQGHAREEELLAVAPGRGRVRSPAGRSIVSIATSTQVAVLNQGREPDAARRRGFPIPVAASDERGAVG